MIKICFVVWEKPSPQTLGPLEKVVSLPAIGEEMFKVHFKLR